jgi:hypothetical protein
MDPFIFLRTQSPRHSNFLYNQILLIARLTGRPLHCSLFLPRDFSRSFSAEEIVIAKHRVRRARPYSLLAPACSFSPIVADRASLLLLDTTRTARHAAVAPLTLPRPVPRRCPCWNSAP